jgi:hypothetical protein
LTVQFMLLISHKLPGQTNANLQEFGITAGGFTNFPANQNYLKEDVGAFYISPYIRTGQHEFSAGIAYPLTAHALFYNDNNINPCVGAIAGYKFYVFDINGRENLFIHYAFQVLRFKGNYDIYPVWSYGVFHMTERDTYINNVIGLGYNLFFDIWRRFGLYYTLDYVISQTGYKLNTPDFNKNSWSTQYIWNNLSTHFGLIFKITSLNKIQKK